MCCSPLTPHVWSTSDGPAGSAEGLFAAMDGRDSKGRAVAKGVYFYRLDTPGFRDVKKAVVAR
jgi:hypothetical protein